MTTKESVTRTYSKKVVQVGSTTTELNESEKVELEWLRKTLKDKESKESQNKAELDKIRKEENRLQVILVNQQKKEDEFKEITEKLQAEVNRLKTFIKKKEQDEEKALKEVQLEKSSHNETLKNKRDLERKVSEYEKELQKVSNLSGQFATLEAKVASSEAHYNEAQNKIKSLENDKTHLEKELKRDREAHHANTTLISQLQESNNEMKQKYYIYEETITTLRDNLLKTQNIYYETKSLLEKAQVDLVKVKELEQERNDLAAKLSKKQEERTQGMLSIHTKGIESEEKLKYAEEELKKRNALLEALKLEKDKEKERLQLTIQNLNASMIANENRHKLELEEHDKKALGKVEEIRRAKDDALQANIKLRESEYERDILRQQLESIKSQFSGLETAYVQLKTPTKATSSDPKLHGEIDSLKNELKARNDQLADLSAKFDALNRALNNYNKKDAENDQELHKERQVNAQLNGTIKDLSTQLEIVRKDLTKEKDRVRYLEKENLSRGTSSREEEVNFWKTKAEESEKELHETIERERSCRAEREIMNHMYNHAAADLEKYRNDFLDMQNRRFELEKFHIQDVAKLKVLEDNLSDFERKLRELLKELNKKEHETELAKTRADQWATEYKRMKKTYDELERQLSDLARRSEYESKKILDLEKEKNDLQIKLNDKDKKFEDLEISYNINSSRIKTYEERINKLMADIEELRKRLSESQDKERQMTSRAQSAEMILAQTKSERDKYKAETVDLSARIDALNTTLHKLNEDLAILNAKIRELENELEKERAIREALGNITAKGPTELHYSDQEKEITRLKSIASTTAGHYDKATKEIKRLEQILRDITTKSRNDQIRLNDYNLLYDNFAKKEQKFEQDIRELHGKVQGAQTEAFKFETLFNTLSIQNKDLSKDLSDAKRETDEIKQKYHDIYNKKQEVEKALAEKENEIKELLKRIFELEEDVKFTREKLSKKPGAIPSSPSNLNQVNKLTKDLLIAEQKIKDLEQDLKNLETEKANLDRYKNEYHNLLKELEKLRKKAEQDSRELQDLVKKNRDLSDQLTSGAQKQFEEKLKLDLELLRENILATLRIPSVASTVVEKDKYESNYSVWHKERSKLIQDLLEERGERQKLQIELRNYQIRGHTKVTEIVSISSSESETKKRKIETVQFSPYGSTKKQRRLSSTPLILPFPGYENEIIEKGAQHAAIFGADANIKHHSPGFKMSPEQVKNILPYFAPTQTLANSKITLGNQVFHLHTRNHNELIGNNGDLVCVIRKGVKTIVFAICPKAKQADIVEVVKDVVNNVDDLGGVREMEEDEKQK